MIRKEGVACNSKKKWEIVVQKTNGKPKKKKKKEVIFVESFKLGFKS